MMSLSFDHSSLGQRVLFASGQAMDNALAAVEGLGAKRLLLIADSFAMDLSDAIAERAPVVARIHDIVQHVPAESARQAVSCVRTHRVDAVISIGGGSSTGLAKIVARDTGVPIVAVPTTFAGSEATNVWGITEADRKTTGVDDRVLPKVVVYDAALMLGLPAQLAISSALNAVAHAVDSFWAPRHDPINAALASEGLRALLPGLRALRHDPEGVEARELTLYGAYLAAVAFASAGSGMHHKICHALGGTYQLAHAQTHAVVLPYVTAFTVPAAPAAAARIIEAIGGGSSAAAGLQTLGREAGAPRSLRELGFREDDIPMAASIILDTIPASHPQPVAIADLETLLHAAWAGDTLK